MKCMIWAYRRVQMSLRALVPVKSYTKTKQITYTNASTLCEYSL